jgi:hypothetical protein
MTSVFYLNWIVVDMDTVKWEPGGVLSEIVDKVSFANFVSVRNVPYVSLYKIACKHTVTCQSALNCQHIKHLLYVKKVCAACY